MPTSPPRRTTVERAFELARSGTCDNLPDIVAALKGERHESVDAHLAGPSIRKDLRRIWEAQGGKNTLGEGKEA
ncbi:MAG: hypothetical protein ACXW27_04710 [Allosphingosinicella sp.]